MHEYELPLIVIIYLAVGLIGFLIALAPLFIWHHVAKMRAEIQERLAALEGAASELVLESRNTTAHLIKLQQGYAKTMQSISDQLAKLSGSADRMNAENDHAKESDARI